MSVMKEHFEDDKTPEVVDVQSLDRGVYKDRWTRRLLRIGVEDRGTHCSNLYRHGVPADQGPLRPLGIQPVPEEQRTDTQYNKLFFIWFSWNVNILT